MRTTGTENRSDVISLCKTGQYLGKNSASLISYSFAEVDSSTAESLLHPCFALQHYHASCAPWKHENLVQGLQYYMSDRTSNDSILARKSRSMNDKWSESV